jgi:hypothetical protein
MNYPRMRPRQTVRFRLQSTHSTHLTLVAASKINFECSRRREQAESLENWKPSASLPRRLRILKPLVATAFLVLSVRLCFSQTATATVNPEADAFVRSADPLANYGGAGAIAVSGPTAVNGSNQPNGAFDSLMRFPMSNVVASLDSTLATHDWIILRATLKLTEMAAPPSPIFNRGVGTFEIRWLASDSWIEGTGIPVSPTTNGVAWNDIPTLLNPATDVSLGQFTNSGADARQSFVLSLKEPFLSDIRAAGRVTLYFTATSPQIGFTADSRSFVLSNDFPVLEIAAAANPHPYIDSIQNVGTNALLSFNTVSNWTYIVQFTDQLSGTWSNLVTLPAQPTNSHVLLPEPKTSAQRFYRLSLFQ